MRTPLPVWLTAAAVFACTCAWAQAGHDAEAQRRLLISVRFVDGPDSGARGVLDSRSAADERVYRVQVLEGERATIDWRESQPRHRYQILPTRKGPQVTETTVMQEFGTVFEVMPRISGGKVILVIDWLRKVAGDTSGSARSQSVSSTVSTRLGEWVELGGTVEGGTPEEPGVISSGRLRAAASRRVWVKVEEIRP
jgi:hypothetical protein